MKIILLTSDYNLPANIALREFLESSVIKKHHIEVAGIISASTFDFNKRGVNIMMKFINQSGFLFFAKSIISSIWKRLSIGFAKYFIPNRNREYFSIRELAKMHKIPFLDTEHVNSKEVEAFIRLKKPDHLVSLFLLQILKKNILDLAPNGSINVHPALMQKHRGIFTSFWAILKKWQHGGATVHYMTEEIDEGRIIVQKHFFVHPYDTIYSVNKKSAKLAAKLILRALVMIKRKQAKGLFLQKMGKLFTMPTKIDIKKFYRTGRSMMTAKEFFNF